MRRLCRALAMGRLPLPSAILLVPFAYGTGALSGRSEADCHSPARRRRHCRASGVVRAQPCPDRERASIATLSALVILFSTSSVAQVNRARWRARPMVCREAPR
jgi:chromate transporter